MNISIETKIKYLERTVKLEGHSVVAINPKSIRVVYDLILGGVVGLLNTRYGSESDNYVAAHRWATKQRLKRIQHGKKGKLIN